MRTEKRNKKSFWKDVRAVSPVIGVILMVAVTVVMAAIIMSWSSSISAPEAPKQCGVSVSRYDDDIRVTVTSIEPVGASISSISAFVDGAEKEFFKTESGNATATMTTVGASGWIKDKGSATEQVYLVLTCTWSDGTTDVLYDGKI